MARSVWDDKSSSLDEKHSFNQDSSGSPERDKLIDAKMAQLASGGIGRYAFLIFLVVMGGLAWTMKGKPYDRNNVSPYQLADGHNLNDKLDFEQNTLGKKVPFEAHIMSKCPDAQYCLKELVLPAMQRVSPKVDFTLSFIGVPTTEDGVQCKHGASECMGNIVELCAANLYPDPKIYLGFTMCLTRQYDIIPDKDLIQDCALEHGLDFDKLNTCASTDDGSVGMKMLRDSVMRSIEVGCLALMPCLQTLTKIGQRQ